tara:strand:+ start:332146 stop:332262 length:117 start_codon:yes stop_codon:yes gene_type:complete
MLFDPKVQKALKYVFIVFAILLAFSMTFAFAPIFTGGY